jgi:hypothetical protein
VKLEEPNGSGGWRNLAEYQYDGQTWRIVKKTYDSGVLDETRHFYFTKAAGRISRSDWGPHPAAPMLNVSMSGACATSTISCAVIVIQV